MPYISGNNVTIELDVVLTEKVSRVGKITSSPIEGNKTVSDHFAKNPSVISITGICTRNAANKISNLAKMYNEATLCKYVGRNSIRNVVITKFDSDHNRDVDGAFMFAMSLSEVKISYSQEYVVSTGLTNSQNSAQVNNIVNVGSTLPTSKSVDSTTNGLANMKAAGMATSDNIYYIVKKGDTLWDIGIKHGVPWQEIATLNNIKSPYTIYPGQKLLVKKGR